MPSQFTSEPQEAGLERLTAIQDNVRSMLLEVQPPTPSSLYSGTPIPAAPVNNGASRSPHRGLFGRLRDSITSPSTNQPSWQLPLRTTAHQTTYSPASQPSRWSRLPDEPEPTAHPAFRHPADEIPATYQERDLEAQTQTTRAKRHKKSKKRRRQHRRDGVWVRQHGQKQSGTCIPLLRGHTRIKCITCIVSGLFLLGVLTIYLILALKVKGLGQEIHVLFILTIVGTTMFFAHSVIRLSLMVLRPPKPRRRGLIPSMAGPEGFTPDVPIPVQLARDEEIAVITEDGAIEDEKLDSLKQPPPAYGLWRCSVRINPNLLHWQKVGNGIESAPESPRDILHDSPRSNSTSSPILEPIQETRHAQPRPPSYISEDGVSYVVSALPGRPPSEIHPAFRIRLT